MSELTGIVIGVLAALLLGQRTLWAMDKVSMEEAPRLDEERQGEWERWVGATKQQHATEGGRLLGGLEIVLVFGALWSGYQLVVGAWLAFKVAVKWEAWRNIVVPSLGDSVPFSGDPILSLWARHRWGVELLRRYLVGTLWNLISAGAGVALGKALAA